MLEGADAREQAEPVSSGTPETDYRREGTK